MAEAEEVPMESVKPEPWGTMDKKDVHRVEMFLVAVCGVYLVFIVLGWLWNRNIMKKLDTLFQEFMESQFSQVGTKEGDKGMYVDGLATFYLYATGRKGLRYMKYLVELRRRQDIFGLMSEVIMGSHGDRVKIVIPFAGTVEPIIFAIVRRRDVRNFRDTRPDVQTYAQTIQWPNPALAPSTLEILSENADLVTALLPASLQKLFVQYEKYILSIHVTDKGVEDPSVGLDKNLLILELSVPSDDEEVKELLFQTSLSFADRIASLSLPTAVREALKKQRKHVDEILYKETEKERQEEAQRKKIEKKQKEKEERSSKSREVQRKLEEKEAKRDLKKKQRSMKKMK